MTTPTTDQLPTVKVKCQDTPMGYIIINASDFDPAKHERFDEPKSHGNVISFLPQKPRKTTRRSR
jgi:hypothetical protein